MFPTPDERYERYQVWCWILGVEPAPFECWKREVERIPERLGIRAEIGLPYEFA
jgi:hypothetical protein